MSFFNNLFGFLKGSQYSVSFAKLVLPSMKSFAGGTFNLDLNPHRRNFRRDDFSEYSDGVIGVWKNDLDSLDFGNRDDPLFRLKMGYPINGGNELAEKFIREFADSFGKLKVSDFCYKNGIKSSSTLYRGLKEYGGISKVREMFSSGQGNVEMVRDERGRFVGKKDKFVSSLDETIFQMAQYEDSISLERRVAA